MRARRTSSLSHNEREARRRTDAARDASRRAFVAGVLAALFAVGGGGLFAAYALRLVRRIRAQNSELQQLDRMKDDFVASVTHELRTPLTSVRGYVELLQDGEAGELTEGAGVALEVADTGTGISAEQQKRLFDRTPSATEQAIPGTGLGLAIVKAIVDGHGGSIRVESRPGRGTAFTVTLPAVVSADMAGTRREQVVA